MLPLVASAQLLPLADLQQPAPMQLAGRYARFTKLWLVHHDGMVWFDSLRCVDRRNAVTVMLLTINQFTV